MDVLYGRDGWADPMWCESKSPIDVAMLNANRQRVGKWWWGGGNPPQFLSQILQPYLRNAICRPPDRGEEGKACHQATSKLSTDATSRQSEEASRVLNELNAQTMTPKTCGQDRHRAQWGENAHNRRVSQYWALCGALGIRAHRLWRSIEANDGDRK